MGGKGSGGRRVGAGRPQQNQALGELRGSRRARARASQKNQTATANQNAGAAPVGATDQPSSDVLIPQPPGDLTLDELAEWNELAPRAQKRGTLTDDEKHALRDLIRLRVLQTRLTRTLADHGDVVRGAGGQLAAHPLITRITTLSQRIDAGMMRFKLAPMGKEVVEPEKPADPFAEFDSPSDHASITH
jgi:hypothetical protein